MSLKTQIDQDIKKAMIAKEKDTLRALRSIKSMILLAETEGGAKAEITEADEMKLLTKAAKQRRDSAAVYQEQGREDLAKVENDELEVIAKYLPKQMSEEEVKAEIAQIIQETGASSPADMGKVMGAATTRLAGKADGKMIANITKDLLKP